MHSTKVKAKRFFHKIVNSKEQDEIVEPPKTIVNGLPAEILHTFEALDLSDTNRHPPWASFVGGFNPGVFSPSSIPVRSPPMPTLLVPSPATTSSNSQSLTMRMALNPEGYCDKPNPTQNFNQASKKSSLAQSIPSHGPTASTSSVLSTNSPASARPLSSPVTSESGCLQNQSSIALGRRQCAGITRAGHQCSRQVKVDSNPADAEAFCFQHLKELMGPSGFYSRKDGTWIDFADWIPHYIRTEAQVALRVEMEKARSSSDVPGYIYTFEIRDPDAKSTIKLKVGRAVNLVKRIDEWEKQCGSKEQVLRGYYPGTSKSGDGTSLMKGRVKAGKAGPWCHRLERLIHIELGDLATSAVYLTPSWPEVNQQISGSSSPPKKSASGAAKAPCGDCGSHHKEIFEFKKLTGQLQGQEWEAIVLPVIEKWGNFVERCV